MSSYSLGTKAHAKKLRKTNGLAITVSFPWWVRDPFICHQQIPSQMWGHFLPGKRYSPAFSNHQIGNSRDGHKLPQLHAAEPDLWDPATSFCAHPRMPEMWPFSGMLNGLVGSPKSWFIPHALIHTKRLQSLLLWYRVKWIQNGKLPSYLASNWSRLTQGTQNNPGHLQVNIRNTSL